MRRTNNVQPAALALGIDPTLSPLEALKAWMAEREGLELRKPVQVHNADFLENSDVGDAVDVSKFPVPQRTRDIMRTFYVIEIQSSAERDSMLANGATASARDTRPGSPP